MKKTLITIAAAIALVGSAFGQGQVLMANNSTTLVTLGGNPVAIGSTSFQLNFGPTALALSPIGPVAGTSASFVGRIANTTVDVGSPGTSFFFRIDAWQGAANYATAFVLPGASWGQSAVFQATTSPSISPPPTATSLAGLYPGFALTTNPIPEPSTMALIGLGAASLVLFRRRKA